MDGSSSGDVIQGSLGDCWFLGALSVLATQEDLLKQVFWKEDTFKEYGFFVLRFFKDTSIYFVFIGEYDIMEYVFARGIICVIT